MKKLLFTLSLLLVTFIANSQAQIIIFRTFEDFQNENGEELDSYRHTITSMGNVNMVFKKGRKKVKINTKEFWGLIYKDALFRIDKKARQPVRLISVGDIMYYENGSAHLTMLKDNTNQGFFSKGSSCSVSKSINSEIINIPKLLSSSNEDPFNKFMKDNPDSSDLFECMKDDLEIQNVRKCVQEFHNEDE